MAISETVTWLPATSRSVKAFPPELAIGQPVSSNFMLTVLVVAILDFPYSLVISSMSRFVASLVPMLYVRQSL